MMDRKPPDLGPEDQEEPPPPPQPRGTGPLDEAEWDDILPPIDEDDPAWQADLREKIREALDDPRPDLTADEVRESLRAHHEERLRRGS